jgi:ankyrin repeat protein
MAQSSSAEAGGAAPAPFRGPAADSALGERLIDVIGIVAAMGFAAEVSHCLYLCGETWRKGDKGATNDMLARSVEKQGWAALLRAAHAAKREKQIHPRGSTQLIRAAILNDLLRVLQLVQLGAPLEFTDTDNLMTALHWACHRGYEHVARALLDGKYEGRGAEVDGRDIHGWTSLMSASYEGHEGVLRLLLARGARQELQRSIGRTALHYAVINNYPGVVALLCAAPGAAAVRALRGEVGHTPLGLAIARGHAACEAVLRAHGAAAFQ